ncbi:DUF6240 domain-containing protein [Parablautia muri]|uniref:Uncharacterized protein n=1 Tax=Parablautia muri TaxID=2320879 RepID=A0A9X5BHJ4_9FIRM|nr:DUF6240 domain-containing protein [Parablautia muri]NBJ94200.1 hypothetical protein [Parablautia muri]
MNIVLEGADARSAQAPVNAGRETTSYRTPQKTQNLESGGFALDISGTVMDNSAYAGHGRTVEEIMLEAGQEDITAKRNYMAVMSNCMSDEDFAKLQKEGFHPGSTDIETVVTILDHIKAALLKGGEEIIGYTDTVSDDALKEITGSQAFANELKVQFAKRDIPLTEENVTAVTEAWNMLAGTDSVSDGSVKYMVENDMPPTPENLYTAKYSAASDGSRQGKGYYAEGGVGGYYAKKPEEIDFEKLLPQMEKVIGEAGYVVDEENLSNARWLVEKGIPLNTDTFSLLNNIKGQHLPVSYEDFMAAASRAIADGVSPSKADLGKNETYTEKAVEILEEAVSIEDRAADVILARDLQLTLKNLLAIQNEMLYGSGHALDSAENIHGRRMLEEIRLSMTVEANLKLLRSGYQIETAPLEELITKLKEAEDSYAKSLMGQVDDTKAGEKVSLYRETLDILEGISSSPAAVLWQISRTDTLREVHAYGVSQRRDYEKAGQSYEALMTEPRSDMGDSIQKAFRNVDDILQDMDLELSDENRRAVRILGYNHVEITKENIRQIRDKDDLLSGVVKEMKPARVLNMIREGVNPLTMSLEELKNYLNEQTDTAEEIESYSKFLYKLEKQNNITQEERSAYIGIYRLVRQLEKADNAAVGALWQSGTEFTLGNLLKAVRSSKRGPMDYSVDDAFGGVNVRETGVESITSQIEKAYQSDHIPNIRKLRQFLEEAGDEQAGKEFDRMLYEEVRSAAKSEEAVLKHLNDYNQPVTADHLLAAGNLLNNPRAVWQEFRDLQRKSRPENEKPKEGAKTDFLKEAGEDVVKALDGRENAQKAYEGFKERVQEVLENMAFSDSHTAFDVKAIGVLYKQMSFMGNLSREENYEIPTQIGGMPASINLKIIHDGQLESQVAITFETQALGKTAAEFKMTDQGLTGFCICNTREGCEFLREGKELFEEKLNGEKIQAGEIYFAVGENLNLKDFSLKESAKRQEGNDSQLLYRAARAFIEYVQETQ